MNRTGAPKRGGRAANVSPYTQRGGRTGRGPRPRGVPTGTNVPPAAMAARTSASKRGQPTHRPVEPVTAPDVDEVPKAISDLYKKVEGAKKHSVMPLRVEMVIRGLKEDMRRLNNQSGPNSRGRFGACCRILNDLNKHRVVVRSLVDGEYGEFETVLALRAAVLKALDFACQALEDAEFAATVGEWPVCQLFSGIRGIVFSAPFRDREDKDAVDQKIARLVGGLINTLGQPASLAVSPGERERWALLPYSTILLGLQCVHEEEFAILSGPPAGIQVLLRAIEQSRDLDGWDAQGIANSVIALGRLLQGQRGIAAKDAVGAAEALMGLIHDRLHDSLLQQEWSPFDCRQALEGLQSMLNAGLGRTIDGDARPLIAEAMAALKLRLEGGIVVPKGPPDETGTVEPQSVEAPDTAARQVKVHRKARGRKPTVSGPTPAQQQLLRVDAKTTPHTLAREIAGLGADAAGVLEQASVAQLRKWLTLIAAMGQPSGLATEAITALARAMRNRVTVAELPPGELVSLFAAAAKAHRKFGEFDCGLREALEAVCASLCEKGALHALNLDDFCNLAPGLGMLLAHAESRAFDLLKALADSTGDLFPATGASKHARLAQSVAELVPYIHHPEVTAVLTQCTLQASSMATPKISSAAHVAASVAEVIAKAPADAELTESLGRLISALLVGVGPATSLNLESLKTTPGRQDLVFALLSPHWTSSQDRVISIAISGSASDALLCAFFGGVQAAASQREMQSFIADDRFDRLMADGILARAREMDLSGLRGTAADHLHIIVNYVEAGRNLLALADVPDWGAILAKEIFQLAFDFMRRGDAREVLALLPKDCRQRLASLMRDALLLPEQAGSVEQVESAHAMSAMLVSEAAPLSASTAAAGSDAVQNLAQALARIRDLAASGDLKALEQLVRTIPALPDGNPSALEELHAISPALGSILSSGAGCAAIRAMTQRLVSMHRGGPTMKGFDAMRLVADIACNALAVQDMDAKECARGLMDVVARKCGPNSLAWKDGWWKTMDLDRPRGINRFVFTALKGAWASGGDVFQAPLDASPKLIAAFSYGQQSLAPESTMTLVPDMGMEGPLVEGIVAHLEDEHLWCKEHPAGYKRLSWEATEALGAFTALSDSGAVVPDRYFVVAYLALLDSVAKTRQSTLFTVIPVNRQQQFITCVKHLHAELGRNPVTRSALINAGMTQAQFAALTSLSNALQ